MTHEYEVKRCEVCGCPVFEITVEGGRRVIFEAGMKKPMFQIGNKVVPAVALMQHISASCREHASAKK